MLSFYGIYSFFFLPSAHSMLLPESVNKFLRLRFMMPRKYFSIVPFCEDMRGNLINDGGEDRAFQKYIKSDKDNGKESILLNTKTKGPSFNFLFNQESELDGFGTVRTTLNRHFSSQHQVTNIKHKLADAKDVMSAIQGIGHSRFPVLTPNIKGFEAALAAGAKEVAVFAAASESFSRSNINCSIEDSLARYHEVALAAKTHATPVRGYISCVVGCPVEGTVPPSKVAYVAERLYSMGCAEISLGDTIGVGTLVL